MIRKLCLWIFFAKAILFSFSACKEEQPYINYNPPQSTFDTTYVISTIPAAQPKEVLIEDISGIRCVNCPQATQIAKDIVAANPNRVNTVTEYPNIAALGKLLIDPIDKSPFESRLDMRNDVAKDVVNSITVPSTLPSGFINRKKFNGSLDWSQPRENWSGDVNAELLLLTPLNINLTQTYDATDKKLTVEVTVTYTQPSSGFQFVHVMLIQDSIIDSQETTDASGSTVIYDSVYVHQHVLMDMLTAHTGDLLNVDSTKTPLIAGRVFKKRFEKILSSRAAPSQIPPSSLPAPQWDPKHLKILAFVSEGATTKYILQSKEIEVK